MTFSKARLARMHDVMAGHATSGYAPGIVTLVAPGDDVVVDAVGTTDLEGSAPIRRDAIFRIASMTKPMVAVATLMLVEECVLRLDEPVDRWLPELADRRVLRHFDADLDDTVPAKRPITVRDLLNFTWGFGMLVGAGAKLVQAATEVRALTGVPQPETELDQDEWLRRLGSLPLAHQPGESWTYNTGSDVLGVLISRASGQSLEGFLRERLFTPLGMTDTGFSVPADQLHRLPTSYLATADGLTLRDPGGAESAWRNAPTFSSGAGGLVSTVDDCFAFAQLLRNFGRHGGERLLARTSVEAMATDQLTPEIKASSPWFPGYWSSRGWGFGVGVTTRRAGGAAVPGQFGWDGGLGTSMWIDPAEDLVGILLTQRAAFPQNSNVYLDFWTSAYAALDDQSQ
ncbi:serine hydrolase domain-containing protein [Cryptosporangium phraense]|uniref:Beta-lactamase family protein n=1 Tax=Cryptosporangium phraense TaxID=2593070 RepID=A0A545AJ52_9ACTN|nr:serine hydrolase domain-containing protein [Cryptosporangium phraense]TQS41343.1 beta-lactamase family protein [Cryptosporangium phraense]